jgi:hypothetical protein
VRPNRNLLNRVNPQGEHRRERHPDLSGLSSSIASPQANAAEYGSAFFRFMVGHAGMGRLTRDESFSFGQSDRDDREAFV